MKEIDRKTKSISVRIILGLNIAAFVATHFSMEGQNLGDFFKSYLVANWSLLAQGSYWGLVTSVFTHAGIGHILLNMLVFTSFGHYVARVEGEKRFMFIYLASGIFASFFHSASSNFLMGNPEMSGVGASGAIAAVLVLFALRFPREKVLFLFFISMRVKTAMILVVVLEGAGLAMQIAGKNPLPLGHGAHLGGMLAGGFFFLLLRSRRPAETGAKSAQIGYILSSEEEE